MANSAIVGTLRALLSADVAEFVAAMNKSSDSSAKFEKQLTQSGKTFQDAGLRMSGLKNIVLDFSGAFDIRKAEEYAEALKRMGGDAGMLGGALKLTAADQAKVNAVVTEALAHYKALGQEAPAHLLKLEAATRKVETTSVSMSDRLKDLSSKSLTAGTALTAGLTVPLAGMGFAAVKAAMDFESSFAGVKKTVDATDAEFAVMSASFRQLATEIPVSVNELNKIGEAAGALGIPKAEIVDFAKVMAELGVTTNLTSDQAADSIARIQNIFGAAGKDTDRLASTLVALGNAGASTEKEIVEMAQRIAGAGHTVGLTQAQVLSFASSLASVGINAEAGGSAISRIFLKMNDAVMSGGKGLAEFARVAGVSAQEFKRSFETDAAGATVAFINGLGRLKGEGENINKTIEGLVGKNIILKDTLFRLAGAGELLTTQIGLGNQAWKDNTALTEEARKRFETTESQMKLLSNQVHEVAITLGEAMLPIVNDVIKALVPMAKTLGEAAKWFGDLPEPMKLTAIAMAAVAAAVGPALLAFGGMARGASSLIELHAALTPALMAGARAAMTGSVASGALAGAVSLLLNPITLAVAAIGVLGVAIYAVSTAETELEKSLHRGADAFKANTAQLNSSLTTYDTLKDKQRLTKEETRLLDTATRDLAESSGLSVDAFKREETQSDTLTIALRDQLKARRELLAEAVRQQRETLEAAEKQLKEAKAQLAKTFTGEATDRAASLNVKDEGFGIAPGKLGVEDRLQEVKRLNGVIAKLTKEVEVAQAAFNKMAGATGAASEEMSQYEAKALMAGTATAGVAKGTADQAKAEGDHAKETKKHGEALDALKQSAADLSGEIHNQIANGLNLNQVVAESGKEAIGLIEKFNKSTLGAKALSPEIVKLALDYGELQLHTKLTSDSQKILIKFSEDATKAFKAEGSGVESFVRVLNTNAIATLKKFGEAVSLKDGLTALERNLIASGIKTKADLQKTADEAKAVFDTVSTAAAGVYTKPEIEKARQTWKTAEAAAQGASVDGWVKTFDQLSATFVQLAQVSGASWGQMAQGIGTTVVAIDSAVEASKKLGDGTAFSASKLASVAAGWVGVAVAAYQVGSAIAASIQQSHQIRNAQRDVAKEMLNNVGITYEAGKKITTGLATGIAATAEALKKLDASLTSATARHYAELLNLDKIIAEVGGLNSTNLGQWADQARRLFEVIARGGEVGEKAVASLVTVIGLFADQAEAAGGLWGEEFKKLIDDAKAFGVGLEEINALIKGQQDKLTSGAVGVTDAIGKQAAKYAELKKAVEAAQEKGDQGELVKAQEALAKAVVVTQDEFDRLSRISLAAFNALVASGVDTVSAMNQVGPGIDNLIASAKALGLSGSQAFLELQRWRELTTGNAELLSQIGNLNDLMVASANLGSLTADGFADLQAQGLSAYEKLTAAGLSQQEAEMAMKPLLESIIKLHDETGLAIDAETQKLIDQARADGVLKAKQIDTQRVLLDLVAALVTAVGGDLPESFKKMAEAGQKAAGDIADAFDKIDIKIPVEYQYSSTGDDSIIRNPNNAGPENETPGFAGGTKGQYLDFGAGTPVILHGEERVMTREEQAKELEALSKIMAAMSPHESKALETGYKQAVQEGFTQTILAFLKQQAEYYQYLPEGDPRLKTYLGGDTMTAFTAAQKTTISSQRTPAPGPGWVMIPGGGWVPPDHPLALNNIGKAPGGYWPGGPSPASAITPEAQAKLLAQRRAGTLGQPSNTAALAQRATQDAASRLASQDAFRRTAMRQERTLQAQLALRAATSRIGTGAELGLQAARQFSEADAIKKAISEIGPRLEAAWGASTQNGQAVVVKTYLDGRQIAVAQTPHMARRARRLGFTRP